MVPELEQASALASAKVRAMATAPAMVMATEQASAPGWELVMALGSAAG